MPQTVDGVEMFVGMRVIVHEMRGAWEGTRCTVAKIVDEELVLVTPDKDTKLFYARATWRNHAFYGWRFASLPPLLPLPGNFSEWAKRVDIIKGGKEWKTS